MEIIRTYGNIIKKYAPDHPLAAFRMIKAGLALEQFRSRNLADKKLPGAKSGISVALKTRNRSRSMLDLNW